MIDDTITIGAEPGAANLLIHRGADFKFPFQLLDLNGDPGDYTGCTLHASLVSVEDGAEIADLTPVFTAASTGTGEIALTATEVDAIPAGRYLWNMLLEDGDGNILGPLMEGGATVKGKRTSA